MEARKQVEGVGVTTLGGDARDVVEEIWCVRGWCVRGWVGGVRPLESRCGSG